jgi:hypothetical protein
LAGSWLLHEGNHEKDESSMGSKDHVHNPWTGWYAPTGTGHRRWVEDFGRGIAWSLDGMACCWARGEPRGVPDGQAWGACTTQVRK